jgi:hypothetical protein
MTYYNVVTIRTPDTYKFSVHSHAFDELSDLLANSLESMGHRVIKWDNTLNECATNIILGYHLIPYTDVKLTGNYIIYQLEPMDGKATFHNDRMKAMLLAAPEVWDYSIENIAYLQKELEITAKHVPLGYHPSLNRIKHLPWADKDIDVLFYGAIFGRREVVLNELRASGLNVKTLLGVYGAERDAWIARSKIVLNLHAYESGIFEQVRVSYLLNNGCPVVSEPSDYCPWPWPGEYMTMVPAGEIVNMCKVMLGFPFLSRFNADNIMGQFALRAPMEDNLRRVL